MSHRSLKTVSEASEVFDSGQILLIQSKNVIRKYSDFKILCISTKSWCSKSTSV